MTEKIYLSPAVADVVKDAVEVLTEEVKALRRGHELYLWEHELEGEDIDNDF